MNKLKKTRQFEASQNTVWVDFSGAKFECANLLKSGIINQSIVLVGYENTWHEVNVLYLGADNSNLNDFKTHIENHNYTLKSIGIIKESEPVTNYMDFFDLAKRFIGFGYLDIEKLYRYMVSEKLPSSKQDIVATMKYIQNQKITVRDYIEQTDKQKYQIIGIPAPPTTEIINGDTPPNIPIMSKILTPEELAQRKVTRINDLNSLGMEFDDFEGNFVGFGFTVTADSLENDSEDEWKLLYVRIRTASGLEAETTPAEPKLPSEQDVFTDPKLGEVYEPEIPARTTTDETSYEYPKGGLVNKRKPDPEHGGRPDGIPPHVEAPKTELITLDAIGNLQPERIAELQGLSEKQDAVVKANPFVKITDAKTLKQAKTAKAALLKASTETEKIETNASKYLNTFKAMIKKIVEPAAKITRDAHKLQADEITAYENAEALRIQAEEKAKLLKIKNRTETLFAVPFVFNGSLYQIGTLYVTPSQVETSTDEEFDVLVKQGEAIKSALDAAEVAESEKDKMIKELQEKLAALTAPNEPVTAPVDTPENTPAEPDAPPAPSTTALKSTEPATAKQTATVSAPSNQVSTPSAPADSSRVPFKFTPKSEYELPAPGNKILNGFDSAHMDIVGMETIPVGYIKSREWLKHGSRLLADEILAIMANPDPSVKKAPMIIELCTIIKNDV